MYMQDDELISKAEWLITRSVERVFARYIIDIETEKLVERVEIISGSILQYIDALYKDNKVAWVNLSSEIIEQILFCMLLRGEI